VSGVTLDAGALLALERGDGRMRAVLRLCDHVVIPASVLAQVWRTGSGRQVPIARLLADREVTEVVPLDELHACAVGRSIARCAHPDIVDVHVALCARQQGHRVITSDPEDIARVDPGLEIVPL
jgi:predicted nucleic acid-binding protein